MPEMLLTVDQAAERLQLHPVTVRRQIERGQIRAIRKGRAVRVPESALTENAPSLRPSGREREINALMADFGSGDVRRRGAAIVRLFESDEETRAQAMAAIADKIKDVPDTADFSAWAALDGEPWSGEPLYGEAIGAVKEDAAR